MTYHEAFATARHYCHELRRRLYLLQDGEKPEGFEVADGITRTEYYPEHRVIATFDPIEQGTKVEVKPVARPTV